MNRHLSRTIAMQSLYEWDFRQAEHPWEIASRIIANVEPDADKEFIKDLLDGSVEHVAELDKMIAEAAPEWPIEQISVIDKTILRIALYELLYRVDVPPKVSINEAVELGKTYGGENSSKFINGVLGTLYRKSDRYIIEEDKKINEIE